jgi:hypothetical protein
MPPAAKTRRAGERAPAAPRVLDELTVGHSVDKICQARNLTRARFERILRTELKSLPIRPAADYAKLQIRRLEAMVDRLTADANKGDLAATDRLLRILDRLDRYHGFVKQSQKPAAPDERDDEAFDRKLDELAARYPAARRTP